MSNFSCQACGQSFQWNSDFAGKRIKCQCGEAVAVPAADPDAGGAEVGEAGDTIPVATPRSLVDQPEPSEANTSDVAADVPDIKACPTCGNVLSTTAKLCCECGFNFQTGKQLESAIASPSPSNSNRVKNIALLVGAAALFAIAAVNFNNMGGEETTPSPKNAAPKQKDSQFASANPTQNNKNKNTGKKKSGNNANKKPSGNTKNKNTKVPVNKQSKTTPKKKPPTKPKPGKKEPPAPPYKMLPITRVYAPVLDVAKEDIPAKLEELIKAVNVRENNARLTTGEMFGRLPKQAIPLMKKALERKDLLWTAEVSLIKGLELIERREAGKAMTDAEAAAVKWDRASIVGGYMEVGQRDPKWDDHAMEGLDLTARLWGQDPNADEDTRFRAMRLLDRATNLGCQDPLVLYATSRHYQDANVRPPLHHGTSLDLALRAAEKTLASKYSNYRKCFTALRACQAIQWYSKDPPEERKKQQSQWLDKAFIQFVLATQKNTIREGSAIPFALVYMNEVRNAGGDRKEAFERIHPIIKKHFDGSGAPELVHGKFLTKYAWDARGSGWASSVTEEGWVLFKDRLTESLTVMGKAWRDYPQRSAIPEALLKVGMGLSSDVVFVEKCLRGALKADPDNQSAAKQVMTILMPRWGGSEERMIGFGRQCLLTGNWEGRLPELLLIAHWSHARKNADGSSRSTANPDYFKTPKVWKDIQAVCEGQLRWRPNDREVLQFYAYAAAGAEQWDIAHRSFEATKALVDWGIFGTQQNYKSLRNAARKNATGK